MPTIYREAGYAFRFRANDRDEPPHVHVEGNGGRAKIWLADSGVARPGRYNPRQLAQIEAIVEEHAHDFLRTWHEYFD
ncbi:MAG: DUF4160 domain-containing protein [Chloroflexota bacterium]